MHNALHGVDVECRSKSSCTFRKLTDKMPKKWIFAVISCSSTALQPIALVEQKETLGKSGCGDVTLILLLPRKKLWLF